MERSKRVIYEENNFINVSEDHLFDYLSGRSFISVDTKMIKVLAPNTAFFLINLMNFRNYLKSKNLTERGWFFCTHEQQQDRVNLSEKQIRTAKAKLKELNIIHTKMKGMPIKEWYFIDVHALYNYLDENTPIPSLQGRDDPTFLDRDDPTFLDRVYLTNKETKLRDIKKEKEKTSKKQKEKIPINRKVDLYRPIAKQLSDIIKTKKNIEHTKEQITQWTNEIRILNESNKVALPRIEAALRWYEINIGGEYIPVIESGRSLRNKFGNLEAAIIRSEKKYTPTQSKTTTGYRSSNIIYREADEIM